eukprot:3135701-Alexandrium_andersonii.AAC.1
MCIRDRFRSRRPPDAEARVSHPFPASLFLICPLVPARHPPTPLQHSIPERITGRVAAPLGLLDGTFGGPEAQVWTSF